VMVFCNKIRHCIICFAEFLADGWAESVFIR